MRTPILIAFTILLFIFFGSIRLSESKAQTMAFPSAAERAKSESFARLIAAADRTGSARVIVGLHLPFVPEGNLTDLESNKQRAEIKAAQAEFLGRIAEFHPNFVKQFDYIPFLAFQADGQALRMMQSDPSVASIQEDEIGDAALAESGPIVGANAAWSSGYTGAGQTVAIIDSGVDKNHTFLSGRVVSEACYSSNIAGQSTSFCPGGVTESTAVNSGLHCPTTVDGCAHGTNVAGIAAGQGSTFSGVARDANVIAIQIFSQFTCSGSPCARYWTSDLIKGIERVRTLKNTIPNIAAVNLSLQTGQQFMSNCDVAHSATKAAIDNLRSLGVATVICSGNFAFTNALTAPACISSSISVGSVDDGSLGTIINTVSNFSNSSPLLHLLAPGRWINSSIPNNLFENYWGTSMAAPHVTGAYAILRQRSPNLSVGRIYKALAVTGQPITDTRNGIVKPRINVGLALTAVNRTTPFDFDDDGKTDIGIFRPVNGEWWWRRSGDLQIAAVGGFGTTELPVPADYTGDGKLDIAYFTNAGHWHVLRSEDFAYYAFPFGASGDVPVTGDYDGDGKADAAVFRPSTSTWYIARSSDSGTTITGFGAAGDVPVTADYDGDGKDDIAIYRPSLGQWWINRSTAGLLALQFGAATDKTVPGDYTGDGKADIAFWRPSTGEWYIVRSEDLNYYAFPFGAAGDIPAPGDYDGDGKTDAAVFRNGTWYIAGSTSGIQIVGFGVTGDRPVPNSFVR